MNIKEFLDNYNLYIGQRKELAIFKDKQENLQFAIIISDYSSNMEIYIYNETCNRIGEVRINHKPYEYIYIYNLYIEKEYRNLNIASFLIELIEHEMNILNQKNIIGEFVPFEFTSNRKGMVQNEEIITRGRNFYIKNGFELVTYKDFIKNKEKYPMLYAINFGLNKKDIIIFKNIKEFKNNFTLINNILVHNNALFNLNEINELLNSISLKLTI